MLQKCCSEIVFCSGCVVGCVAGCVAGCVEVCVAVVVLQCVLQRCCRQIFIYIYLCMEGGRGKYKREMACA